MLGETGLARGSRFSKLWRELLTAAEVSEHFTLQDIRRTAASEAERVERGAGETLLQHRGRSVTQRFYLSSVEELRDVVDRMRVPTGFNAGPAMSLRANKKAAAEAEKVHLKPHDFETELGTDPALWRFGEVAFWFRKPQCYRLRGMPLRLLRKFVKAGRNPVSNEAIRKAFGKGWRDPMHQASVEVARLRGRLRQLFGLGHWDPLPCLDYGTEGNWILHLPAWLGT